MSERGGFGLEYDGVMVLARDDERTRNPLSERYDDGYRYAFIVCCDCGKAHEMAIGEDHFIAVTAEAAVGERLRAAVRASDPSYFPLRPADMP